MYFNYDRNSHWNRAFTIDGVFILFLHGSKIDVFVTQIYMLRPIDKYLSRKVVEPSNIKNLS